MSKSKSSKADCNILMYIPVVIIAFYLMKTLLDNNSVGSSSERGYLLPKPPWTRGNCDISDRFSNCLNENGYNDKFTSSEGARTNNAIHTKCIFESRKNRQCPSVAPGVVR